MITTLIRKLKNYNKITQDTYDAISENWETKRLHSWKPIEEFLENIESKEDKTLIDLGCGGGRNLELGEKLGFKKENILGSDYSIRQLNTVKQKGFKTKQAELTNLPFEDNSFDIVICIAAHHHLLEKEEQLKSLEEIKRILNDKGKILLSNWFPEKEFLDKQLEKKKFEFLDENKQKVKVTYTDTSDHKSPIKHDRYYYLFKEKELLDLCTKANLNIEKKEYHNGNLYLTLN